MKELRRYLISHVSILFFSLYLALFTIASMIFLIKLATYTAIIRLDVSEMGMLYLFTLPELFFYTLPVAFVVSAALTLYRLSNDNELVVVFSLGISPSRLAKILAIPALLLSGLMLVDSLLVTPYVNIASSNFLEKKKAEAKFNLTAAEFGHTFGEWMLYIHQSNPEANRFEQVVLFKKGAEREIFISARTAELANRNGVLELQLSDGESFSYDPQGVKELRFQRAYITNALTQRIKPWRSALDYWTNEDRRDKKIRAFITNLLLSCFPVLSLWLVMALGIVHARHQKRWIYLWLFVAVSVYYALSVVVQQWIGFHALWAVPLAWAGVSYPLYYRLVTKRF